MKYLLALLLMCSGLKAADCARNVTATTTSSGNTPVITAGAQQVRICAIYFSVQQGTTATSFGLIAGNSSACATNQEDITLQWDGVANAVQEGGQEVPSNALLTATAGKDVCLKLTSAPVGATVQVIYDLF